MKRGLYSFLLRFALSSVSLLFFLNAEAQSQYENLKIIDGKIAFERALDFPEIKADSIFDMVRYRPKMDTIERLWFRIRIFRYKETRPTQIKYHWSIFPPSNIVVDSWSDRKQRALNRKAHKERVLAGDTVRYDCDITIRIHDEKITFLLTNILSEGDVETMSRKRRSGHFKFVEDKGGFTNTTYTGQGDVRQWELDNPAPTLESRFKNIEEAIANPNSLLARLKVAYDEHVDGLLGYMKTGK